jgi:hypothetical protein
MNMGAAMKQPKGVAISVVRRHAADALRRARKLPIGQTRNLRQLAICLLWLEKNKGTRQPSRKIFAERLDAQIAEVGRLSWRPLAFEARDQAPRTAKRKRCASTLGTSERNVRFGHLVVESPHYHES